MTGNRTLWRLAWRGARAEPLRHLLIVGMIAVAVAASITTSIAVRTEAIPPEVRAAELMGAADLSLTVSRDSTPYAALPGVLQAEVDATYGGPLPSVSTAELDAAIAELAPPGTRVAAIRRATPGLVGRAERSAFLEILAADPGDPALAGFFVGDVGVRPGSDEALASPLWLDSNGVEVGDRVELPAIGQTMIVGELTTTAAPLEPRVIVAPETELPDVVSEERYLSGIAPERIDTVAAELGRRLDAASALGGTPAPTETLTNVQVRDWYLLQDPDRAGVWGGLVALVLLVLVGFVASASFATGSRRRVREVGLLATVAGATPQQLRTLIRREALVLGITGALLGAGLGLGLVAVTAGLPTIQFFAEPDLDGPVVAVTDVLVPVVLGVLAALGAAWSPARTVARVPLVAALAGRVPLRRVARWVTPASLALTTLGVVVLLWLLDPGGAASSVSLGGGSVGRSIQRPPGYVLGVAAVLVGIAGLGAPLLQRLGALAGRLPLRARLAVRDSARQRTRSSATVAATMVVLVVPVLVLTGAASEGDMIDGPGTARGDVAVVTGPRYGDHPLSPTPEMVAAARDALPPIVEEITVERATSASPDGFSVLPDSGEMADRGRVATSDEVVVATPELLELLGVPDAPPDAVVVSTPWQRLPDSPAVGWLEGGGVNVSEVPVIVAPHAIEDEMIVVGVDLFERSGLKATSQMTLLRIGEPLTGTQADTADHATSAELVSVQTLLQEEIGVRRGPDATLVAGVFGGAVLLALVVAAMTAALAATESDRDLRTMASIGADPRNRPRFRAWQSAYQVLLGGVLAVPAGVLLAATMRSVNGYPERTVVPWLLVTALVTLVPLVVAIPFRLFSHPSGVGPVGPRES